MYLLHPSTSVLLSDLGQLVYRPWILLEVGWRRGLWNRISPLLFMFIERTELVLARGVSV